jgi:hypothetical protein
LAITAMVATGVRKKGFGEIDPASSIVSAPTSPESRVSLLQPEVRADRRFILDTRGGRTTNAGCRTTCGGLFKQDRIPVLAAKITMIVGKPVSQVSTDGVLDDLKKS